MPVLHDDPVFDRTREDVINRTAKGVMNSQDFIRVELNLFILATELSLPFAPRSWMMTEYPYETDYEKYRTTLTALRQYAHYITTPEVPDAPINTWQKWNAVEKIIYDVNKIYDDNEAEKTYMPEVYAGERIGVL